MHPLLKRMKHIEMLIPEQQVELFERYFCIHFDIWERHHEHAVVIAYELHPLFCDLQQQFVFSHDVFDFFETFTSDLQTPNKWDQLLHYPYPSNMSALEDQFVECLQCGYMDRVNRYLDYWLLLAQKDRTRRSIMDVIVRIQNYPYITSAWQKTSTIQQWYAFFLPGENLLDECSIIA